MLILGIIFGLFLFLAVLLVMMVFSLLQGWYVVTGICGGILLLIAVLFMVAKRKLITFLKGLAKGLSPLPATITLNPIPKVNWPDQEMARNHFTHFAKLGFKPVGCFSVLELEGVEMIAFFHPQQAAYGLISYHPDAGNWSEVYRRYEDDGSITVTSSARAGVLDRPENSKMISMPGYPPAELFQALLGEKRDAKIKPASAEAFKEEFENAWAREMRWRNEKGGASEEEIRRVAEQSGMEVTDEMVATAREIDKSKAEAALFQDKEGE